MASANSSRRRSSVPHRPGGLTPAGGGTCRVTARKIAPTKLVGVQFASAIVPPGRQTRTSSPAARSWSGVNITPTQERTESKEASG